MTHTYILNDETNINHSRNRFNQWKLYFCTIYAHFHFFQTYFWRTKLKDVLTVVSFASGCMARRNCRSCLTDIRWSINEISGWSNDRRFGIALTDVRIEKRKIDSNIVVVRWDCYWVDCWDRNKLYTIFSNTYIEPLNISLFVLLLYMILSNAIVS